MDARALSNILFYTAKLGKKILFDDISYNFLLRIIGFGEWFL
jgi:hypothetical protein